ncbi:hypothetical protein AWC38_SpisGene20355 [Stylophora pistillata]|uniref:Integrase catalytic domain-containing protein n=1 Tax=Stylophora pistillata TaxID=50429 RepID=A0A2B4RCP5_STYPI|nr:hypothetical protein AWC38_SpisGene20355 [Stylophora pistillata]
MKVIALCLCPKKKPRRREIKRSESPPTRSSTVVEKLIQRVTLSDLQEAEKTIIRCFQYENFREELQILCHLNVTKRETDRSQAKWRNQVLQKTSSLYKLDPFVYHGGIICVGGCIRRADGPVDLKHPFIIPQKGHLTELLIQHHHLKVSHRGREQRSEVKHNGVLFTCMGSRSVHLETANSLESSSFMNALRRFMNQRGAVRQMRSDQGTNFIGARGELKAALGEMNQDYVQDYLLRNRCEWIPLKLNVSHSSHMGGTYENMIRSVRNTLEPLLLQAGSQVDDETLRTLLTDR